MSILVLTTDDKLKLAVSTEEVAKMFSTDTNKQQCFLGFDKENQIKWCEKNINQYNVHRLNCRVVMPNE